MYLRGPIGPGYPASRRIATRRQRAPFVAAAALLATLAAPLAAQNDGFADTTFGSLSPGFSAVAFDLGGDLVDGANAVAVGHSGRLLLAGNARVSTAPYRDQVALACRLEDGTLDSTFNFGGQSHWDFLSLGFDAFFFAVGELSDGVIVAAGTAFASGISYPIAALVRPDGKILDQRLFGYGNYAGFTALAVQPDDKIVLAGYVDRGTNYAFLLERLNSDFSVDYSFGSLGRVEIDFDLNLPTYDDDLAHAVAVQRDGKILVAGSAEYGANDTDMAVARLLPNGALDPSFGPGTGKRTVFFDLSTTDKRDTALAVAVDRLGRIYLAGSAQLDAPPYSRAGFARLDAAGGDDLTFGNFGNGRARFTTLDNVLDVASGAVVQDDNRLVASGTTPPGTARKVSALRLTESGGLDSTWGGGFGVVAYNVYYSGAPDTGTTVALQGGRAVVAGYASVTNISTDTNFAVMRLDATLAFEDDFELGNSKRWSASGP